MHCLESFPVLQSSRLGRAGCFIFIFIVFLMSCGYNCSLHLSRGALGSSALCVNGISLSYLFSFLS